MISTRILLFIGMVMAATLAGCGGAQYSPGGTAATNIEPAVRNAIAYCSGGIESETQGKIEAAVVKNGGKISGGLNDSLKGIFASRPGLNSADAIQSQRLYMECLDKRAAQEKTSDSSQCSARLACEIAELQGACACRTTVIGAAKEKGYSEALANKLLTDLCYTGQHSVKKCWQTSDVSLERARCESALSNAGLAIPKPTPGSCLAGKA